MNSLQGHFLIASPQLADPNFFRSVVLIVQHNDDGALGLVLNRPIEPTIEAVWEQISEEPCSAEGHLHKGGPCDGPLMVVHTDETRSQIEVIPGVHFSTEKVVIEELATDKYSSIQMKFFVGYAGWGAGQLEREIAEGSWQSSPASADRIFDDDAENCWDALRQELARTAMAPWIDPRRVPPDPTVN